VGPSRHFVPQEQESLSALLERVGASLRAERLGAALLLGFGHHAALAQLELLAKTEPGLAECPMLLLEGRSTTEHPIAGLQVVTCLKENPERLRLDGRCVGTLLRNAQERHCLLGGLLPEAGTLDPSQAARQVFAKLERALASADFGMEDLIRTWFYNHRLLSWYDAFNVVRRQVYASVDFRSGAAPASTGIDGRNTADAALLLGAWAVQGASTRPLPSPLQCPAPAYGSSFSRSMELGQGGLQRVFISGTASIAEKGESLWRGDPFRQIETTMEVIQAIATSRGLSLRDTDRAVAYFKHGPDVALFRTWLDTHDLSDFPFIATESDICRGELLFELELDLLG